MKFELRAAGPQDQAAIRALLTSCGLPTTGVEYAYPHGYVVALTQSASDVVGCAGVEVYGAEGLMRSVAVGPAQRGYGLGTRLVADRMESARRLGVVSLYLLTTSASAFFEDLGFQAVQRSAVPAAIRGSAEFASICPTSATVLRRALDALAH